MNEGKLFYAKMQLSVHLSRFCVVLTKLIMNFVVQIPRILAQNPEV